MNIAQCRMARAALDWTLDDLAEHSKVSRRTIAKFEQGGNVAPETVEGLRAAFVTAGIAFTNGGARAGVTYPLTGRVPTLRELEQSVRAMPNGPDKDRAAKELADLREAKALHRKVRGIIREKGGK